MMKCVETLRNQKESREKLTNLDDDLINALKGTDDENAHGAFTRIVGKVIPDKESFSWGRLIAIYAFTFSVIEVLVREDKLDRISSVSSWLEAILMKQLNWIAQQGDGKGWRDFITFSKIYLRSC